MIHLFVIYKNTSGKEMAMVHSKLCNTTRGGGGCIIVLQGWREAKNGNCVICGQHLKSN